MTNSRLEYLDIIFSEKVWNPYANNICLSLLTCSLSAPKNVMFDRTLKNVPILFLGTFKNTIYLTGIIQLHHDHVTFALKVFINVLNYRLPAKL